MIFPATVAGQPFIVGQDPDGRWLVLQPGHHGGALFRTRQDALHFAGLEAGHRPGAIEMASTPLHLKF